MEASDRTLVEPAGDRVLAEAAVQTASGDACASGAAESAAAGATRPDVARRAARQAAVRGAVPRAVVLDSHHRVNFLFQAAAAAPVPELARLYGRHMDLVAKKNVLRRSPHLKRAVCKRCDMVLGPGRSRTRVENRSRQQAPHADVLVVECGTCGTAKRFAVGANRGYLLFIDEEAQR